MRDPIAFLVGLVTNQSKPLPPAPPPSPWKTNPVLIQRLHDMEDRIARLEGKRPSVPLAFHRHDMDVKMRAEGYRKS